MKSLVCIIHFIVYRKHLFRYFILSVMVLNSNQVSYAQGKHPALIEKEIITKIERQFKNRNYADALRLWQENEIKYRSSILYYYWGGLIHLFHANETRNDMILNYKKGINLLTRANKFYFRYFPFDRPDLENHRLARESYINSCFYLAIAHYYIGNLKSAIEYIKMIVRSDLNPDNEKAWYNLGVFYESMGQVVEANRAFSRYLYLLNKKDEEL